MTVVRVMQNDVGRVFTDTLTVGAAPPSFADATLWWLLTGPTFVEAAATVANAQTGAVSYTSGDGDLDVAGLYRQQWEIRYGDGTRLSFPDGDSVNWVDVVPDVTGPGLASA